MKNLIILPFDHRSSFARSLIKKDYKKLTGEDKKKLRKLKTLIFGAFLKVYNNSDDKQDFAVLVDEEFGSNILQEAKKQQIKIILTTEKTSWPEYDFEYGEKFESHIQKIKPDFVKVLVRYNVENKEVNKRQLEKLKKLSVFCHKNKYPLLFELLVPPTESDLHATIDKNHFYRSELRIKKTVKAIEEILQENKLKVIQWFDIAKKFEKIIGFAVGRTIFLKPLMDFVNKKKKKQETVDSIAKNFEFFVRLWRK